MILPIITALQNILGMTLRAADFPRVQGFVYNDGTGEAFLNGKQCKGVVPEEFRGIKIRGRGS
jgi:hypothetical protein